MSDAMLPLVELVPALTVYCTGLAKAEKVDEEGHYYFYTIQREGDQLVRAITLHLIVPVMASIEGMQATAEALGLEPLMASRRRRAQMDG